MRTVCRVISVQNISCISRLIFLKNFFYVTLCIFVAARTCSKRKISDNLRSVFEVKAEVLCQRDSSLLLTARQRTGASVIHPHNTTTACEVKNNSGPLTNNKYFSRFRLEQGAQRFLRTDRRLVTQGSRSPTFLFVRVWMLAGEFY